MQEALLSIKYVTETEPSDKSLILKEQKIKAVIQYSFSRVKHIKHSKELTLDMVEVALGFLPLMIVVTRSL